MTEDRSEVSPSNIHQSVVTGPQSSREDDEISILEIFIVISKHKKMIFGIPFLAAIIAAGISLLMPNWYTATAKLMPPQQSQSAAMSLLGQLGALTGGASQALGLKNPSDIFVAMLKSRTVSDAIIEKFRLQEVYDEELLQDTREALAKNVDIIAGRDSVITIDVDDKSPKRAAEMANAYVEELEKVTARLAVGEAGQRRLFFEQQLKQAKDDLTKAETELTKFQIENRVLNPIGQAGLAISAAAGLQAQIAAKEVQITALKSFATQNNPDLIRAREELAGLKVQLGIVGRGGSGDPGDVLLAMGKAPQQGVEYVRLFRDMKYFEVLYELLARQYEIARIDEAKEATIIQVLDKAVEPERKSKPKRALIVVLTAFVFGIIATVLAFIAERLERAKQDPILSARIGMISKRLVRQ
jgi:tyrosine-protein kinase Etk/Wzc